MPKLGDKVRDRISGFEGIVVARTEWLYGCVRFVVQPQKLHEGKPIENQGFDEAQLEVLPETAVENKARRPDGGDRDYVPTRR